MQQTGTVNYTDLVSRSASVLEAAAQRVSKADIDTSTIEALTKTCIAFKTPPQKEEMILAKVKSLRSVALYNNKFFRFGLGLTHALTDITQIKGGLVSIALCACLLANYDKLNTAHVLQELAILQGLQLHELPGTQRWITLLEPCAGMWGEEFNDLVSALLTILEPRTPVGIVTNLTTPAKRLAEALHTLAKISHREEQGIVNATFTGGYDCAWLGAVAVFVLDLSLRIVRSDGSDVHQHNTEKKLKDGSFHVEIVMGEGEELRMAKSIVHLPRGRVLFQEETSGAYRWSQFKIRSSWDTLMRDSFGDQARVLLETKASDCFAKLLLYAVCRSSTLDDYNPFIRDRERYEWPNLNYGLGCQMPRDLWESSAQRFSELKPCMDKIPYDSYGYITEEDARECFQGITRFCDCRACSGRKSEYCLIGVAGAIMRLFALLSIADLDKAVPTPFGLRRLYERSQPLQDGHGLRNWRYRWPRRWSGVVNELFELFCTRSSYELIVRSKQPYLALASEGVCCFYDFLTDIRKQPGDLAKVRVICGNIQVTDRCFQKVEGTDWGDIGGIKWTGFKCPNKRTFHMSVRETIDSDTLQVDYVTKLDGVDPWSVITIAKLTQWAEVPRQDVSIKCSRELYISSPDLWAPDLDEQENDQTVRDPCYNEFRWDIYAGTPEVLNDITIASRLVNCLATEDDAKSSLLLITWDPDSCDNLVLHKSSTKIWEDRRTSIEHIYAEFGESYCPPAGKNAHWEIVKVSDCVRCVLTFVSSIWPILVGDNSLPDVIRGSLLVYSADGTVLEETHYRLIKGEETRKSLTPDFKKDATRRPFPLLPLNGTIEVEVTE